MRYDISFGDTKARFLGAALLAVVLTACQAPAPRPVQTPELTMIGSGSLSVPQSCRPSGSVIVDFTVLENGETADISPAAGPACLQQALTAWVATFRYTPVATQTKTSIEWLLVEARKGS